MTQLALNLPGPDLNFSLNTPPFDCRDVLNKEMKSPFPLILMAIEILLKLIWSDPRSAPETLLLFTKVERARPNIRDLLANIRPLC